MRLSHAFLIVMAVTSCAPTAGDAPTAGGVEDELASAAQPIVLPCTDPNGCPDLISSPWFLRAALTLDTRDFSPSSCPVQEGSAQPGLRRLLRMNVSVINVGAGELNIGSPAEHPELFEFDGCQGHEHFHFIDFDQLRLWRPDDYAEWTALRAANPTTSSRDLLDAHPQLAHRIVEGRKQHFCLGDNLYCEDALGCPAGQTVGPSLHPALDENTCAANQGITPGWMDAYPLFLEGQWIEAPNQGGTFILEEEVNDTRIFEESDYTNNSAAICVNIPPRSGQPFVGDPSCINPLQFEEATECEMCLALCAAMTEAGSAQAGSDLSDCACEPYVCPAP